MKRLKLFPYLPMFLFTTFLIADERFPGELKISNIPEDETMYMTASGTAWRGHNDGYVILTDNSMLDITLSGGTNYILDLVDDDAQGTGPHGTFGFAIYTFQMGEYLFEFDWRDSDFHDGTGSWGTHYNKVDVSIRWDNGSETFQREDINGQWIDLMSRSIEQIWGAGYKDSGYPPRFNHFQPTNPSNLEKMSDYYGHPRFTWDRSDPISDAKYNIWRRKQPSGYVKIESLMSNNSYIDSEIITHPSGEIYHYKTSATSGDGEIDSPGFSNIITYSASVGKESVNNMANLMTLGLNPSNPNPFNSVTSIAYSIPEESIVELVIYDLRGRKIKILVNDISEKGIKQITWNGTNDKGKHVSSGMYFYKLTAVSLESEKTYTKTGKMVLLR